jgi:ABC-type sugar transport system ATPase subunit
MAGLRIANLHKAFGAVQVLRDINLDVADGEFVVFVGPSGCGKSTLLRLICGLDDATEGRIEIEGETVNDVPSSKRGIAMVFQSYALYPHMTVAQNMGYALRLAKAPKDEIARRVQAAAEILKITPLLARKPRQLSGGQRQRVAIGRAIVREPRVFLFDEPLSNLDAALRVDMRMEFARLKARLGTTMIYVTHDQIEAMTLADKIVVMNEGRIEQVGSPLDLYERPANRFVAGFIGSPRMNFLPVLDQQAGRLALPGGQITLSRNLPGAVEVGIRPEHIVLGAAEGVDGRVVAAEQLGSDTFIFVEVPGCERLVQARIEGSRGVAAGTAVRLGLPPEAAHFFDATGASIARPEALRRASA